LIPAGEALVKHAVSKVRSGHLNWSAKQVKTLVAWDRLDFIVKIQQLDQEVFRLPPGRRQIRW
jgi:hypothetical protein